MDKIEQVLFQLFLRDRRHLLVEQAIGRLAGNQRRSAMVGAFLRGHADCFQRQAVGIHRLIGDLQKQWVLRSGRVEFLQRKTARSADELVFPPATLHHEPLAWLHGCRLCGHDGQRLVL